MIHIPAIEHIDPNISRENRADHAAITHCQVGTDPSPAEFAGMMFAFLVIDAIKAGQ